MQVLPLVPVASSTVLACLLPWILSVLSTFSVSHKHFKHRQIKAGRREWEQVSVTYCSLEMPFIQGHYELHREPVWWWQKRVPAAYEKSQGARKKGVVCLWQGLSSILKLPWDPTLKPHGLRRGGALSAGSVRAMTGCIWLWFPEHFTSHWEHFRSGTSCLPDVVDFLRLVFI